MLFMLCAVVLASGFVFALCSLFAPTWDTNDDVAMSMVAHGYGIAAIGSPNLIFSNVLWGYLVRLIPEINGVLGYSLATFAVLVIVGTIIVYGLLALGLGIVTASSALILLLTRPILFPQFTINAGLMMLSAIICLHLFARCANKRFLWIGCLLAYLSYLVRSHEFLLVLLVALPLLPWRTIRFERAPKIAFTVLIFAIGLAALIDQKAYQGSDWNAFNELNHTRALFTDFGAGGLLKQRADILENRHFSVNDIDLISNWFFVDPTIADPANLNAMLYELVSLPKNAVSLDNALLGVKALWHPKLLPIVLAALFLFALRPSWRVAGVFGLAITAVFTLGLLGRPGTLRVIVPLVCVILIAPLLVPGSGSSGQGVWRHRMMMAIFLTAAAFNFYLIFPESNSARTASQATRESLHDFPSGPVVIWGETFPFEEVYPALSISGPAIHYRLYGLGVFTLAPFSTGVYEVSNGRGMIKMLLSDRGIPAVMNRMHLDMLENYCKERQAGTLVTEFSHQYGGFKIMNVRCDRAK